MKYSFFVQTKSDDLIKVLEPIVINLRECVVTFPLCSAEGFICEICMKGKRYYFSIWSILLDHITFVRLLDTNFELQGIYGCTEDDELLLDNDVCIVSYSETIWTIGDEHGWRKYLLHCWVNLISSIDDII